MNAKEKAEQLYDKFLQYVPAEEEFEHEYAKKCALIAIDEVLNNTKKILNVLDTNSMYNNWFWEEVKQEIEKL